jgi:CBS domain-containing protein
MTPMTIQPAMGGTAMTSRKVSDVIKGQNILVLPKGATVRAASREMANKSVGSVMVVENGKLVGIFTERDALFRVLANALDPDITELGSVMTPEVTTIGAGQPLLHALHLMHDNGFRHVPVVKDGVPLGMISIRDALGEELVSFERQTKAKDELMEIVG